MCQLKTNKNQRQLFYKTASGLISYFYCFPCGCHGAETVNSSALRRCAKAPTLHHAGRKGTLSAFLKKAAWRHWHSHTYRRPGAAAKGWRGKRPSPVHRMPGAPSPGAHPVIPCIRQKPACGPPQLSIGCPQGRQYPFLSLSRTKKQFFRYHCFAVTGYEKFKSNRFFDISSFSFVHIPVRFQKQAAPNPSVLSASCQLRTPQNLLCARYLLPASSSHPPAHPVFMPKKRRRFFLHLLALPHFSIHKTPSTAVPFGGIPPKGIFSIGISAPFGFSKCLGVTR